MPITEDEPQTPVSPYGRSKLMVEHVLADYAAAEPEFRYAALRYFNACGCDPDGVLGEDHDPETHLIPVILQAVLGKRDKLTVFGTDYPTPDGTCVRDYVHVNDLADAHLRAMDALDWHREIKLNLGTGRGFSVREIIKAAEAVTGEEVPVEYGDRRPGDAVALYADPSAAKSGGARLGGQVQGAAGDHRDLLALAPRAPGRVLTFGRESAVGWASAHHLTPGWWAEAYPTPISLP